MSQKKRLPEYDRATDGNVFQWIVSTAAAARQIEAAQRSAHTPTLVKPRFRGEDRIHKRKVAKTL